MKKLLEEYLNRISILGTGNRYLAIIDILDEIGVEYRIQENTKDNSILQSLNQLSFLEEENNFDIPERFDVITSFENEDDEEYLIKDCYSLDEVYTEDGEIVSFNDFQEALEYVDELNNMNSEYIDIIKENINSIDEENQLNGYYIIQKVAEYGGFEPISEETYKELYDNEMLSDCNLNEISRFFSSVKNIIISFNNKLSKKIVLMAHYDAVNGSTAANDNGSSVAILLCLIKHISEFRTDKNLEIVFVDKEETGGFGCRYYLQEYGDNISEVINLDTCGVGTKIVLNDFSRHISNDTSILIDDNILNKFDVISTDMLPYCDTNTLIKNYDTMTICTFPDEDIPLISSIKFFGDDKFIATWDKEKQEYILSGYSRLVMGKFFKTEVYKYMHNGERDSIEWINYDIMFNIYKYLENII